MKYYIIIEDSVDGVSAAGASVENGVADSQEKSLAALIVANFSNSLALLNKRKLLHIEPIEDTWADSLP